MGQRIRRVKVRKLVVEIKTISQVKQKLCTQVKQNKEFIHYFPMAGGYLATSRKAGLCYV